LRLIDSFSTQLKAQGPSRTCDESNEEARETPLHDYYRVIIRGGGGKHGRERVRAPISTAKQDLFVVNANRCLNPKTTEIPVEQQPPQGVFVCDHAGRVINQPSLYLDPVAAAAGAGVDQTRPGASANSSTTVVNLRTHYFTEMCSGSEAGLYLRLIDFVYHSTPGVRVIKKKKKKPTRCAAPGPTLRRCTSCIVKSFRSQPKGKS